MDKKTSAVIYRDERSSINQSSCVWDEEFVDYFYYYFKCA